MPYAGLHIALRILRELGRSRRALLLWGLFPALMLLLFGFVHADERGGLGPALTITAPGILLGAALFFSCLAGPVSLLVGERERHTLRRLLLTPVTGAAYFLGIVWAHVVIAMGQALVVYGITLAAGGTFVGSPILGVLILVLSVASYVGIGFFLGARLTGSTEDVNGPVAAIGVPLLVLGGTFFSSDLLPPFLYTVAHINPVFHMNQALKAVAGGTGGPGDVIVNISALGGFAIAAVALGASSYRDLLREERWR